MFVAEDNKETSTTGNVDLCVFYWNLNFVATVKNDYY